MDTKKYYKNSKIRLAPAALCALMVVSCASQSPVEPVAEAPGQPAPLPTVEIKAAVPQTMPQQQQAEPTSPGVETFRTRGTDNFVRNIESGSNNFASGNVTLNFDNTGIEEVARVILGDLLQENYVVDPKVQGSVTLQTSRPFAPSALLPILEQLLSANGAALVRDRGLYRIVTLQDALKLGLAPQVGSQEALPAGFQIRIVPLQFVSAEEMKKILTPLANPLNIVNVDAQRNLMILAGTNNQLQRLLQTINTFDVDWMEGKSFALFTPNYVDAKTLVNELNIIFGEDQNSGLSSMVRLVPIERLNALLVVTPRVSYLEKVEQWVERLDLESAGSGRRLFIYHVQNGKAVEIADVMNKIFENKNEGNKPVTSTLAPGLEPVDIETTQSQQLVNNLAVDAEGLAIDDNTSVRIIADEVNNTLVIMATALEYRMVKAALEKLDIIPLQVLIEATIAEITLTDDLEFGLQWYFKNNFGSGREGIGALDLGASVVGSALGIPPAANTFTYSITSAGAVRAVLTAMATESKVDIISSPSLMVLNNQKASIQVGDQVPIEIQNQSSTGGTILNSFEYRDTGILLSVTPRVNAGGLITMEIEQEASNVGPTLGDGTNPIITQRKIQSVVAVKSGETVVLGGLIDERKEDTRRGVPILHTLPGIGHLFGETIDDSSRKELVVLLTPRAVSNSEDAQAVTEEFRSKMQGLKPFKVFKRSNDYKGLQMEQSLQGQ